ncbi:MAG: serine/threonine-protein kinase [Gemmatimonadetes bacterium]|nr:serine/threonine-protein kinase [Gemmatimonadota bacterium]
MSEASDLINAVLGHRYRIEKELGSGGFATVWLAEDVRHRRKVAVKVLHPEVRGAVTAERFLREIEIAARLAHPNIVPMFESGEEGDILFFVMPYHGGESLHDRLARERQLPVADALRIGIDVADGLSHAHREGIVHRDIKPSNILLSDGHALIADFGIARALSQSSQATLTASGIAVGTAAYMSPEQAAGDAHVDGRADIYALGCVLYEMLAGEPPFRAVTPQAMMMRHVTEPPPSLTAARPGIAPEIDAIVQVSLAKLPADRFSSADELRRELRAAMETAGTRYTPPDAGRTARPVAGPARPGRSRSTAQRIGMVAGVLAVGVILLPVGRALSRWFQPVLDPDKVMVFPLDDRGGGGIAGAEIALAVINALEFGEPLRPLDGWRQLAPEQRGSADFVSVDSARALSERVGASRFIQGSVLRQGDSITVALALYETRAEAEVDRQSASGSIALYSPSHVALQAVRKLLPAIIDPGRAIDISPILDRDPNAIAQWIEGDRAYRFSHFGEALDKYERAIELDSLLTFAALKGVLAANWLNQSDRARRFLDHALAGLDLVPGRYRHLAHGLDHYADGRADSAAARIRAALDIDPDWSEAWMALGEVHHHLLPSGVLPGRTDRDAFEQAARLDDEFSPPLIHLTEQALREGRLEDASRLRRRLEEVGADPDLTLVLDIMHSCVRDGPERTQWQQHAALIPGLVFGAARLLSAGAYQSACAKAAYRALLDQPVTAAAYGYDSMVGLQGLLVAEGRYAEATVLVDSVANHARAALTWYVLDLLAGAPMEEQAARYAAALAEAFGEEYTGVGARSAYVIGCFHDLRGELARTTAIRDRLQGRAISEGDPLAGVLAQALSARTLLTSGDTAEALSVLAALKPVSPREFLSYNPVDPLPAETITRAQILLRSGRFDEAINVASVLDHPEPNAYLAFVPQSLAIRLEAARLLRRQSAVAEYRDRLTRLGRADLVEPSTRAP